MLTAALKQLGIHLLRGVAAVAFVLAGANHFRDPTFYQKMIPPEFPNPAALVVISGICETVGGLGLLIRPVRRLAGCGLIALLIAVFPANLYMALHPELFGELGVPTWALWLRLPLETLLWVRLPLQAVFIALVWYVGVAYRERENARQVCVNLQE